MSEVTHVMDAWLRGWMTARAIPLWGVADLRAFDTPHDETGQPFPTAISWAWRIDPGIMRDIASGPTKAYADEYARANDWLDRTGQDLSEEIRHRGFRARPLDSSTRTYKADYRGEFPHKTAATRAGLGWIGRNCQLVTREFGPWVRLGSVFTDAPLKPSTPVDESLCGDCRRCVDACPAGALKGELWTPGLPREELLDPEVCDAWKSSHYGALREGGVCGICASACPSGIASCESSS